MNILFAAINFALIVWASLSIADHYGDAIGASVAIGLSALNAIRYNLEAIRSRHDSPHASAIAGEDDEEPETPSGEPENWVCGDGPFNLECGMIASAALSRLAELGVG